MHPILMERDRPAVHGDHPRPTLRSNVERLGGDGGEPITGRWSQASMFCLGTSRQSELLCDGQALESREGLSTAATVRAFLFLLTQCNLVGSCPQENLR